MKVLRLCHQFLFEQDGYDLDIQDICISTMEKLENHIIFPLAENEIENYILKNDLIKKDSYYFHNNTNTIIHFLKYKSKGSFKQDMFSTQMFSLFRQIDEFVDEIDPDIIHIHGTALPFFTYTAFTKRNVIAHHHIGKLNWRWEKGIRRKLLHNLTQQFADKVLAVSNYSKESFVSKKKVKVLRPIPRIINDSKSISYSQKKVILKEKVKENIIDTNFQLNMQDKIIFYPARFTYQKNQFNLTKAFLEAVKQKNNLKLILAGKMSDENYFDKLDKLIQQSDYKDNVCIVEELENHEVHQILAQINLLACPSINEALGRVAMEAKLKNVPVLASHQGGYKEIIKNNLVDCKNINAQDILSALKQKQSKHKKTHQNYIEELLGIYQNVPL